MDMVSTSCKKLWEQLIQKSKILAPFLASYSYWFLICVRIVALELFLGWRIKHPNEDAIWLSTVSVVCEFWFSFTWLLDQLPKLLLVKSSQLDVLKSINPSGKSSHLPSIDVFVSTADPEKEPPLVTANTILSILAADYPVGKLSCYVSDDAGALLTFEAMAEAANFAKIWVPFCRKHCIEPRNPESYFNTKRHPCKTKLRHDFVRDCRQVKREYEEFKVRINALPYLIQQRADACNAEEDNQFMTLSEVNEIDEAVKRSNLPKATWMVEYEDSFCCWPGTWIIPAPGHSKRDHASIIQVMLVPPEDTPARGKIEVTHNLIDLSEVDTRLPMLVYVSREKHPGFDHNKKAGAMNALLRVSAIMSNGPFILNLDCDHYIYNSHALREGICYMMDCDGDGDQISYVQFPQRFEAVDPSDRYANHNKVFFDINMRALNSLQGPFYVGTGCLFRRTALYGFDPPRKNPTNITGEETMDHNMLSKRFGHSSLFVDSILDAEFKGRQPDDYPNVVYGQPQGNLRSISQLVDATAIAEAVNAVSCWYEDKTQWGSQLGWIYGSVTEDVVTGYRMHNRGWTSAYCMPKFGDAFRGTAPCNLTDRLHQVLRWATGSVEIFFSRNNALLASTKMKFLQRIAYVNVGIYPFTSIFLIVYCFIPAISLLYGEFIVKSVDKELLLYLMAITISHSILAWLEIKWAGIKLEEWWRNEQFWLISGTSSYIAAVLQGLLKVIAGVEVSFSLTSKSGSNDDDGDDNDEFADLYTIKWSFLMLPPMTIIIINLIAIAFGVCQTIYSDTPHLGQLAGGIFFSFWILAHLYPFAKGLMGKYERTPTIVFVWSGLVAISICLLWVAINTTPGY